jgi:small subunit ribosomal protein S1
LGGVDGLVHVSQMSWDRIAHPSEVLREGQTVRVKITKIDSATGKISLSLRDLAENPWARAAEKYPVGAAVRGTVSKLMEFGAFVRLEPGVEGLIHISELSHKRVMRTSDVLREGQQVDVKVLSVAPEAQRISLSLKALEARPEAVQNRPEDEEQEVAETPPPKPRQPKVPLKGGLGRSSGGERHGLKW